MRRRIGLVASAVVVSALVAGASPAAAAQIPTPNGLCGARNMMNPNARPHMLEAMMLHTAPQGDAGMFHAVAVSSC